MIAAKKNISNLLCCIGLLACAASGCEKREISTRLASPYEEVVTLAVAPVVNFSGEESIDTLKVTDLLFSELQQVEGFAVIPVNRVLAQMTADNMCAIRTPQEATELAHRLGADALVVAAITEYNPYYPPVVGLAVQIYGFEHDPVGRMVVDPVGLERMAAPIKLTNDLDARYFPKTQVSRVYNARNNEIAKQVKSFAKSRGAGNSPFGWELYLRSQQHYLRFVFYRAICEILEQEAVRVSPSALPNKQGA